MDKGRHDQKQRKRQERGWHSLVEWKWQVQLLLLSNPCDFFFSNSNQPLLFKFKHVYLTSQMFPTSISPPQLILCLASQVRSSGSLWSKSVQNRTKLASLDELILGSSTSFFFWSFLYLFQYSPSSLTIGDPWTSLELRALASLKT